MQSFTCKLTKLKKGNRAYDLLKHLKDELFPELEYSLITQYYAAERATVLELFNRFESLYRTAKQRSRGVDYDDLEEYAVRLLEENPDVHRRLQNQFDQVLMDEFQDTNGRQARLLELLRPPGRFYAVGDINQSIYGFRHAEPQVFGAYRDEVARRRDRLVELVENFRSRAEILKSVEKVTAGAEGIEPRPLVPGLSFPDKPAASVEAVWAATAESEAQWVAGRILELQGQLQLRERTAEFRDFAMLVRNSEVLAEFTSAFDQAGIPYLVNRGKGFYETREVVDLMHLLRVVANPRDEISMAALLRSPFVEISDEALLRLKLLGIEGMSLRGRPQFSRPSPLMMPKSCPPFMIGCNDGAPRAITRRLTNCCSEPWTSAGTFAPRARAVRPTSKNSWHRRGRPIRARHSPSSSTNSRSCANLNRASPTRPLRTRPTP